MANNKMEEILEYLGKRTETAAPTVGEVAEAIGMGVESTRHMLIVLQERGYIKPA
jgi:DNA-binding IclR family transcriptional regulator